MSDAVTIVEPEVAGLGTAAQLRRFATVFVLALFAVPALASAQVAPPPGRIELPARDSQVLQPDAR